MCKIVTMAVILLEGQLDWVTHVIPTKLWPLFLSSCQLYLAFTLVSQLLPLSRYIVTCKNFLMQTVTSNLKQGGGPTFELSILCTTKWCKQCVTSWAWAELNLSTLYQCKPLCSSIICHLQCEVSPHAQACQTVEKTQFAMLALCGCLSNRFQTLAGTQGKTARWADNSLQALFARLSEMGDTRVLDRATRPIQLMVKEALHIQKTPANSRLNRDGGLRVTGLLDRDQKEIRGWG